MTLEKYAREVTNYLCDKIPDINPATAYEIAEFFVMKSSNFATDKIVENNKTWQEYFREHDERWKEFIRNTYK